MTFNTPCAGELPGRVAMGTVNATMAACRAYRIGGDTDYRKQANKLRLTASGFDRRAIYIREDGDDAGALRASMEAQRLRRLADSMEADANAGDQTLCVNVATK